MAEEKENLKVELRRELERIGLPRKDAAEVAGRQIDDNDTRHPGSSPPQHVIPVTRGWVVIRDVANLDVGLFFDKEDALEEARTLATASDACVILHEP